MKYQKTRMDIVGKLLHYIMLLNRINRSCSGEMPAMVFSSDNRPVFLIDVAVPSSTSILFFIIYLHSLTRRRMLGGEKKKT